MLCYSKALCKFYRDVLAGKHEKYGCDKKKATEMLEMYKGVPGIW